MTTSTEYQGDDRLIQVALDALADELLGRCHLPQRSIRRLPTLWQPPPAGHSNQYPLSSPPTVSWDWKRPEGTT